MRSLFGARTDVFALRWENVSSGKAGWVPAARGGWANKRARKEYLPLTDEVIVRHLRGDATVGIYSLMRGDTCTLLACDFDVGTWVLDALAYLDACHRADVPAELERSRSRDGAHVWVFFDGPVAAATARSLGTSLLREAMTARAELDLSSYDRFFASTPCSLPFRWRSRDESSSTSVASYESTQANTTSNSMTTSTSASPCSIGCTPSDCLRTPPSASTSPRNARAPPRPACARLSTRVSGHRRCVRRRGLHIIRTSVQRRN